MPNPDEFAAKAFSGGGEGHFFPYRGVAGKKRDVGNESLGERGVITRSYT